MSNEHLIGRLCTKLAGREAARQAVIVDVLEGNFVLIDGQVKRRRCNLEHLEISPQQLPLKPGASTAEVQALFEQEGLAIKQPKSRNPGAKPIRKRAQHAQTSTENPEVATTTKTPLAQPTKQTKPAKASQATKPQKKKT